MVKIKWIFYRDTTTSSPQFIELGNIFVGLYTDHKIAKAELFCVKL